MPRLDQLLAKNLGQGRRHAAALIAKGAVKDAKGEPLKNKSQMVTAPLSVSVYGQPMELVEDASYLLHKPIGCVTARKDEEHPTAYALLQDAPLFDLLRPVGRLDLDTSGLLLWTTQGEHVHAMTHPKRAVSRSYHVGLHRPFTTPPPNLELRDGHRPKIHELIPLQASQVHPALDQSQSPTVFAQITLHSGAYHEVRRIFAALDSHVLSLCRIQHGPWTLPKNLPPGQFLPIDLNPGE